jgi:hypothetical protein
LRMVPAILDQLPTNVVRDAPDYTALRAAILGLDALPPDERSVYESSRTAPSNPGRNGGPDPEAPPDQSSPDSGAGGGK